MTAASIAGPSRIPIDNKSRRSRSKPKVKHAKVKRRSERQQIDDLEKEAMDFVSNKDLSAFEDLPISSLTKRGLKKAFFKEMTDIQAQSLPVSLKGKDVLGAARTGSGKTLAFLIPVLEVLHRRKWGPQDGLGALIISPTRELAVQIFEVLRSIGPYHSFSAGLVIGGKSLKDEKDRLSRMNILVATPGRLLQHMDQTIGFDCDNLQMLVLDEADRILDLGFAKTLSALLSHLPPDRQTLLFSATQSKTVSELARLSLKDPVSIGVSSDLAEDGENSNPIPKSLEQHYAICTLDKKLDILWSFIRSHLQSKILVFLSSCKQVKFVFETFCKLHPGIPLIQLQGKLKQTARLKMYQKFTSMSNAVLIATDIAARGLDFPSVNWVVQVDVPEDADTYIHRVGRTARYNSTGKSLMLVLPSEEEGVKAALARKKIEINSIKIRPSKTHEIQNQLQNLAFQDPEIKYLGQRAFVSYMRSVHLQKDKSIFKVQELPVEKFAESMGLPGAPKIKFLDREIAKKKKNTSRSLAAIEAEIAAAASSDEEGSVDDVEVYESNDNELDIRSSAVDAASQTKNAVKTKYDRMFGRKNQMMEQYSKMVDQSDSEDNSEEDFITLKRGDHEISGDEDLPTEENKSKKKLKKEITKKSLTKVSTGLSNKIVFDESGAAKDLYEFEDADKFFGVGATGVKAAGDRFAETERTKMQSADITDKAEAKDKKREKKRKRRDRERDENDIATTQIIVGSADDVDDGYVSPDFDLSSEDETKAPASKRVKHKPRTERTMEDDEELALALLTRQ